ncbi:YheC/YheD family protein [Bacillus dakarensis]|uniref:YheC/YheD family endospore coat-associated protein n=1 Tax=Robertmurraya dakarensis TaxID=1926278 RepID=UPI0009823A78|nr:YheC/YheD family protein [Bacillus dakarensis]
MEQTFFKIIPQPTSEMAITIHVSHSANLCQFLSFGMQKVPIQMNSSEEVMINELHLSDALIQLLNIPTFCDFEIIFEEDTIILGPYLGILTPIKKNLQTYLNDLNGYIFHYHKIKGAIAAFSIEDIDMTSAQILKAYIYNPKQQEWIMMPNIPFPSAIFNRCKVTKNPKWSYISTVYQKKIFNYPTFHKWEMYEWLQREPSLRNTLPKTALCNKPRDILRFLKTYKRAYLKPIGGTFAKGIIEITVSENVIHLRYQKRKKTIHHLIDNRKDLIKFLRKLLQKNTYIMQEAIELLTIDGQIIDFRQIYLKNQKGLWQEAGLFARYGKAGSAVSNITSGGKARFGEMALMEMFPEDMAKDLLEQITNLCRLASSCLEEHLIQCGNLGFDFAIDKNQKLWIIEINNEDPDHRIALVSNRKDLLYYTRLQNMLYTKFLSGFNS